MVYMRSVEWGLFLLSKGDQVSTSISGVVTKSMMLDVSTRTEGKNDLPITELGSVEGGDRKLNLHFLHPTGELSELVRDVGKEAVIEIFAGIAVGLPVLCHRVRAPPPPADKVLFHWGVHSPFPWNKSLERLCQSLASQDTNARTDLGTQSDWSVHRRVERRLSDGSPFLPTDAQVEEGTT